VFEGRAAIGYDHGYDAQKFYLGLALDPKYIEVDPSDIPSVLGGTLYSLKDKDIRG
jgi:hypothetical protein